MHHEVNMQFVQSAEISAPALWRWKRGGVQGRNSGAGICTTLEIYANRICDESSFTNLENAAMYSFSSDATLELECPLNFIYIYIYIAMH